MLFLSLADAAWKKAHPSPIRSWVVSINLNIHVLCFLSSATSTWGYLNHNFSIFPFPTFPFLIQVLSLRIQNADTQQQRALYRMASRSAFWMYYLWKFKLANKLDLVSWNWFIIPYIQHFKKLFWANYILSWSPGEL